MRKISILGEEFCSVVALQSALIEQFLQPTVNSPQWALVNCFFKLFR